MRLRKCLITTLAVATLLISLTPHDASATAVTGWGLGAAAAGGWVYRTTATFAAHPTIPANTWNIQPLDSTGGAFTYTLPPCVLGDRFDAQDVAANSSGSGIGANAVTLSASIPIQNPHTMSLSANTYVFGTPNDGGGSAFAWQCATNSGNASLWKVVGS